MTERTRLRLHVLQYLVVAVVAVLLARLWYLQVAVGDELAGAARTNSVREVVLEPTRGAVLDALGRPLVGNRTSMVVTVDRAAVLQGGRDGADDVFGRLGALLGVEPEDLDARTRPCGPGVERPCWDGPPTKPVAVAEDVGLDVVLALSERAEDFPGVVAEARAVRAHPQAGLAAQALGHLRPASADDVERRGLRGREVVGASGLEAVYDDELRGADGVRRVAVDTAGRVTGVLDETPARPGEHLVLHLDAGVQALAEQELARAVQGARSRVDPDTGRRYVADGGALVVMDVRGRVLALASAPSYDPDVFVGGLTTQEYAALTDPAAGSPLLARAWQGEYAPASTWKVVSTAAAVRAGAADLDGRYDCPGSLQVGDRRFRNYGSEDLGVLDLRRSLVQSCDTVYYRFAYDEWVRDGGLEPGSAGREPHEVFAAVARDFGFGRPTGVDLTGEADGRVPDRDLVRERADRMRDTWCRRGAEGYPDVAAEDPVRAEFLQQVAAENCAEGDRLRAGDAVNASIGQGDVLVTPLQLAVAFAALANGGDVVEPRLARAVLAADGSTARELEPPAARRLDVDPEVRDYVRDALAGVTRPGGTAAGAFADLDVAVSGKTGTAEVANRQDTSWFASFGPTEDPRYVVVGVVTQAGTGGSVAAPMVAETWRGLLGDGRPRVTACDGTDVVPLPTVRADGTVEPPCPLPPGTPAGGAVEADGRTVLSTVSAAATSVDRPAPVPPRGPAAGTRSGPAGMPAPADVPVPDDDVAAAAPGPVVPVRPRGTALP